MDAAFTKTERDGRYLATGGTAANSSALGGIPAGEYQPDREPKAAAGRL